MNKCLPIIAVVLLAAACDHEPSSKTKHGDQLAFKTESAAFQEGDLIGVSMDSPLSYVNVKMTYSSGSLTPGNKLYWPVDMPDSAVTFLAYYPYSAEYNEGGDVVFSAAPDQSDDAAFRASCLMTSITKAAVTDPSVVFDFEPKMTKLVFYVRNDSGSDLKDILLTAYPSVHFKMDKMSPRLTGEKVDIHAHLSATSAEGVAAYEAVIAPQSLSLVLTVKTSAAEYTANCSVKTTFASGKQYSNERLVVLEEGKSSRPINFKLKEADWALAPDFVYQDPLTGGAALEDISDPGLYKIAGGIATPIYSYAPGTDQYSLITGNTKAGWRLQNPAGGEMFEISSDMVYGKEGLSSNFNIRSFGLSDFEADYSSTATSIKVADGLVWLLDDNKEYGYIIMSE